MYDHGVDPVTAFILAGGKSSRMGQDKAFMQLGRQTLLQRALELARTVGGEPRIVGNAAKFAAFAPVVEDVYPECGPLGGIHAALSTTPSDLNLMIAVDLPFLQPDFLKHLLSRSRESGAVVVVPRGGGRLQPLCGVYRQGFAAVAERSLRAGRNKIDPLFAAVHTCIIEPDELKQNGFSEQLFRNVNTQEDWGAASLLLPS